MSAKFSSSEVALRTRTRSSRLKFLLILLCLLVSALTVLTTNYYITTTNRTESQRLQYVPLNAQRILQQCAVLKASPGPADDFHSRRVSDRFEPGTNATLIKNAKIWTGLKNGTDVVEADVLLDGGLIKEVGHIPIDIMESTENLTVIEANGAWVTPGIVDLHSHAGLLSAPFTRGTFDVNSPNGPILPWLRSIDGFNTHDEAFELAIAGGVTSAQILPGSGNPIGGQAFMVKLRKTSEHSPTSMIIEPPHMLNGSEPDPDAPLRWRHLKQACGENLKRWGTRMDTMWSFRWAYNEARKVKLAQDTFCAKAEAGLWNDIHGQEFPQDLQWEALVDVLRGRVRISNHCYEAVDLDDIVRLSNEFGFHIASFHHASEAWLVPGVLNRTCGGPPAVAIFATTHRYKRESYRGSEFASSVLSENGIPVVLKSDHPVLKSRYLLYEAQQAHYYGFDSNLALAAVTSAPAHAAGMSHRIGLLHKGADADVVLWDSHPLQLGAAPRQVWIDGIPQLKSPNLPKPDGGGKERQDAPAVPTWDKERKAAVEWEGLPPLGPKKVVKGKVVLKNVREVWMREEHGIKERWAARPGQEGGTVVLESGAVSCVGRNGWCFTGEETDGTVIDLHGGSVGPGLVTMGSPLGIEELASEPSTGDGFLYDPYSGEVPKILSDTAGVVRAADALQFGTRNALHAYRAGVTYAASSLAKSTLFTGPTSFISGLSVTFRTGADHALEHGAIINPVTALHVTLGRPYPYRPALPPVSVSTQIATLRRLLLNAENSDTETGRWFKKAARGAIPLIVEVHNADMMATLLKLKANIEESRGSRMQLVFSGATEAYLLAKQIAQARVRVLMTSARSFPESWDQRRALPGPPLTNDTALSILIQNGVTVALGVTEAYELPNTRFEAAWAALSSNGRIDKQQTYELITTNVEKVLGIEGWFGEEGDVVLYDGGDVFDLSSKVVAVASPRKGVVEFF